MNSFQAAISELDRITAEMASIGDIGDLRLTELLKQRQAVINTLLRSAIDPADERFTRIMDNALILQERLESRCNRIRRDLNQIEATSNLMADMGALYSTRKACHINLKA